MAGWWARHVPINQETVRHFTSEPVPYHLRRWWWCLGGTPAYLFVVMATTGILMTFYYVPRPPEAYYSVQRITEEVPYGWYIRSVHRWAANLMIITVILHMMRVYFTGAYRCPREINWMIGVGLLVTTLLFGFTGYSLIYEQLSYWGVTVASNLMEATPLIGPWLARLIRGGAEVGETTWVRLFVFHIGVLPTIMTILLICHFTLIRLHGVTPYRFPDEPEGKTYPFFPDHVLTELAIGVFLMFLLTCLACIFPAELGPIANPLVTPEHIKPEWYFYFTFRLLKLMGLTWAVLTLGFMLFITLLWPFIDAAIRKYWPESELSVYIGIAAVVLLCVMTVWEAMEGTVF